MSDRLDHLLRMRDFLDREIARELAHPTAGRLIRSSARLYGVTSADVMSQSRGQNVVRARQAACWLMRQSGMSYPDIGRTLRRDHTTVIHAVRAVENSPARRDLVRGLLIEEAVA